MQPPRSFSLQILRFFSPQSQEHPPANTHTRLGAVGGLDCSHYGFWWKGEHKWGTEGLPALICCRHAQPRSGSAQERGVGLYSSQDLGDHAPLTEPPWGPHTWRCPKTPAWSCEPPGAGRSRRPRGRAGAHLPAPTCRGGSGAGARPRRCCGCERGRGERAEAAGHRRPRRHRTCQLLWKTSGRKAALLAAPGSGASAAWAPASQHSPPRRRQPGVGQVGWSRRGLTVRAPTPCPAPPLLCLRAPPPQQQLALPVPGFPKCAPKWRAACPACREGYGCPRDVPGLALGGGGAGRALLRETR